MINSLDPEYTSTAALTKELFPQSLSIMSDTRDIILLGLNPLTSGGLSVVSIASNGSSLTLLDDDGMEAGAVPSARATLVPGERTQ